MVDLTLIFLPRSQLKTNLSDSKMCSKLYFYAKLTGFGEMERYLTLEFRIIAFQLYTRMTLKRLIQFVFAEELALQFSVAKVYLGTWPLPAKGLLESQRLVFYLNPSKYTQFFKLITLNNNLLKNQPFLKSMLLPSDFIITSTDNFKALSNKWYENYKTCKLKGLILTILL